jgi:hypothetical protein
MKIYKPQKSFILGNSVVLIFPLILTIMSFSSGGKIPSHEIKGLVGFWVLTLLLTFVPLVLKIGVGDDYVKHYFLGFLTRNLKKSDVEVLEYGNLLRAGGLGFGKGLKAWERRKNGLKYYSVGENAFGKEAIEHIRRVLSKE